MWQNVSTFQGNKVVIKYGNVISYRTVFTSKSAGLSDINCLSYQVCVRARASCVLCVFITRQHAMHVQRDIVSLSIGLLFLRQYCQASLMLCINIQSSDAFVPDYSLLVPVHPIPCTGRWYHRIGKEARSRGISGLWSGTGFSNRINDSQVQDIDAAGVTLILSLSEQAYQAILCLY